MEWYTRSVDDDVNTISYHVPGPKVVDIHAAFDWCVNLESKGRFYTLGGQYNTPEGPTWHFELEADAMFFSLKWGT